VPDGLQHKQVTLQQSQLRSLQFILATPIKLAVAVFIIKRLNW